jgi:enoyl-CoA hydratase
MSWEIRRDGHVAIVHMTGTKANAQNETFFASLHATFDRLEHEFADCAVVLTAEGPVFSAGIDFESAFAMLASDDLVALGAWIRQYQATNLRLWRYPRPTVAAVNGHAFAGGAITALDCDYRIGVSTARFSLNEVPIGIAMPAIYVEIIRYAMGTPAGSVTTLFGATYDARGARELGFIHEIASPEDLLPSAVAVAGSVPPEAFEAYAFSKRALQAPAEDRIRTAAAEADENLPRLLTADPATRLRARRYAEIKGRRPSWDRGEADDPGAAG